MSSAQVWGDIEKAYEVEHKHNERISKLNQENNSAASLNFQSLMLGLMLLGESEQPLISTPGSQQANPTSAT